MISVIIPVFNKEKYLEKCISSIINQTYKQFECLIIDDGSTDNSSIIIKKFLKIDNRIRYVYQKNSGVSSARNKGLDLATNDWICFVDADDYLAPDYLENLIQLSSSCNCAAVFSNSTMDLNLRIEDVCDHMNSFYDYRIFNPPWGKLYKRQFIVEKFNENFSVGEDLLFNLSFFQNNCDKLICFNKYQGYVYNEGILDSLSNTVSIEKIQEGVDLIKFLQTTFYVQMDKIIEIQSNSLFNKIVLFCYDKQGDIKKLRSIYWGNIYKFASHRLKLLILLKNNRFKSLQILSGLVIYLKRKKLK